MSFELYKSEQNLVAKGKTLVQEGQAGPEDYEELLRSGSRNDRKVLFSRRHEP